MSENSFWYGGQLSVASGNIYKNNSFNDRATNIGTLGVTAKVGYQVVIKSFYVDFFGGVGYALTNNLFGSVTYSGDVKETNQLWSYGLKTGIVF